jgi:hypothetical protein
MGFRLGSGNSNQVLSPTNKALTKIAQARVESTVGRAIARHENALRVDGSDIYLWIKGNGGLICTCRQPPKILEAILIENDGSPEALRMPIVDNNMQSTAVNAPGASFNILHNRGTYSVSDLRKSQSEFEEIQDEDNLSDSEADLTLDGNQLDDFNSLTPLDTALNDTALATLLSEGGAISGGDKTACGICFGTGRTHGYEFATGRRIVLDASNEFIFTCYNGAQIVPASYPAQFSLSVGQWVEWKVDLPSYTSGWLNFTIRDNLKAAKNLQIEWMQRNKCIPLNLVDLAKTEGSDRTATRMRVKVIETEDFFSCTFTHVELIYNSTKPLVGQCPPINFATNFEVNEPIINTEFEILAGVIDIPRESVFQDSKFKYLWKVLDVTPKMTAQGQIFSYNLNARMVHRSETLYALRVIFDPQINVHYRGLEIEEGGLERDDIEGNGGNSLSFRLRTNP